MINQLSQSICYLLTQLENALEALSDEQFCEPIPLLGNASIGQHIRHILEFYIELGNGYQTGIIDYDKRKRDHNLETIREMAIAKIQQINRLTMLENKELNIMAEYSFEDERKQQLPTNYYRELMYNLEHTVHHMALIRVGFSLISKILLPEDFGIAASTLKYRKACAQ
ncbi:DinB family protein [Pedobacter frigiditerrae]|uniref:DinB family protein n=1 Tax=Pedobacter frigiditerrae TaxID=2530452 RepID=UPI00292D8E9E|nr:DinB family protein [Pedobacter frigiditerrae]